MPLADLIERLLAGGAVALLMIGAATALTSPNAIKRLAGLSIAMLGGLAALAALGAPQGAIVAGAAVLLAQLALGVAIVVRLHESYGGIETPDLDQQLLQARADLASQEASAKLSEATLTRRKSLIASNFVSMQEIDERSADLSNKKAAVNSGQANVERLEALAGYKKITVPFDGVVTARDTDVGALINAGGGSGPPMFVVSDISKLRVYVNVPQSYVPAIRIGGRGRWIDGGSFSARSIA